eukprot:m.237725 g.237725  ORF g.237725 m.237725 type:complete len:214 (-) comp18958_c1_seq12:588-1229(-)
MRGCLNTHTASRLPGCPESPLTRTRNCIFLTPNGIKQFWRHWPEQVCAKCQIVDGTPNYLPTPEVPARIAETFPEWRHKLRFAMVLRDPVERAESHWGHASRLAKSSHSVAWATNLVEGHTLSSKTKMCNKTHIGCLRRFGPSLGPKDDLVGYASCMRGCQLLTYGLYDAQVAAWYNHFDPRQFCIITSEYLKEHTQEAVHRVAAFFHLDTLK